MKILIWLCIFLSIPLLAFTATKQPSAISTVKETGKALALTAIILMSIALLRFPAKRYLFSKHSKLHSFLRNTSHHLLRHHHFFALSALILLVGHGTALFLSGKTYSARMALGSLALILFCLTSFAGYQINKQRPKKPLFYNLHMTFLLLALSTTLLHIKYKVFAWLF